MQFGLENEYEEQKHNSNQKRFALTTNYINEKLSVRGKRRNTDFYNDEDYL